MDLMRKYGMGRRGVYEVEMLMEYGWICGGENEDAHSRLFRGLGLRVGLTICSM